MEFEFKRGFGEYSVQTSMGHEIIGRWLQEEIGRDLTKIEQVLDLTEQAKHQLVRITNSKAMKSPFLSSLARCLCKITPCFYRQNTILNRILSCTIVKATPCVD
ncbi:hypothetical protein JCM19241_2263 [Vibrio ishigakensis]|uniref:Uncharacterized protein n=1 Tax=Vibrio ishigakensis TaxID=1481914 RepID=A0A0B8QC80_9VIBR|nr:hypothetical protein JCM19241_2263 [Vibrio ishigakensis]